MATATVEKNAGRSREGKRSSPGGVASGGRFDRAFRPQPKAALALRASLSRHLARYAVDDSARSAALLCAQEALANAITHGGAGKSPVAVSVRIDDGELRMEVSDRGGGCDPAKLDLESLPDLLDEHGRGLFPIRHLMDDLQIISDCQGTTLRMTLHLC